MRNAQGLPLTFKVAAGVVSVLAVAVTGRLKVADIIESMLVHPTLSEALAEAAE